MNKSPYQPMEDEDLLFEILLPILEFPENLKIEKEVVDDKSVRLVVSCDPRDRGRTIGKNGCNASALRQIFRSIGYAEKRSIFIDIHDRKSLRP